MGLYTPDKKFPDCQSFYPDDTDEEFYLMENEHLSTILNMAKEKWSDGWAELVITAEYIHTTAIGYDLYVALDYTNYLKITRIKPT